MRTEQGEICGRYRLLRKVGEGGSGVVYQALDVRLGRSVALKALHDPSLDLDLEREGFSLAQVAHPNVVALHDVIEDDGRQFLVMEYVDGATLEDVLAAQGSLGVERAVALVRRIAAVVAHAHDRGILHCDLKPANVLLTPNGDLKLSDFTLARMLSTGRRDDLRGGSVPYAAPEQFDGEAGPWTDVYGLGALLRRLAGPLDETDEMQSSIAAVVHRATEADPHERFPSVRAFLAALPPTEGATQLTAPSTRSDLTRILPPHAASRAPRRWPLGILCIALALSAAAVSAHFTVFASPDRVTVPGLVATQSRSAELVVRSLALHVQLVQRYASAPAGTVLTQRPKAGSEVLKGATITLLVSKGPAPVAVPDLSGMSQSDAQAELAHLGFKVVVRTQDTISQPAGLVLNQTPASPARLRPGTTVTITVSTKPWWWIF